MVRSPCSKGLTVRISTVPARPWPLKEGDGVLYTTTPLISSEGY